MTKSYSVPANVQATARRGLREREKYNRGGLSTQEAGSQGIGSGVARARDLASGKNVSLETVKRMSAFWSRHKKNYRPDKKESDGGPTAGTVAARLWGFPTAESWVRGVLRREEMLDKLDETY